MGQYQSFPDASGASRSLEKLKAMRFGSFEGKSFLDVGCNEGFFCGYARFDGATRVCGIDQSREFIDRARQRFPDCEFLQQGWERLPDERFDVILLASALHYAADQPALINALIDHLTDDGTLVLELGVSPEPQNEWITVKRGIDTRPFPTWAKLKEVLSKRAWKYIGPSVTQAGDPVPRHVIHIQRRKPMAYLLMQPPAFGKSMICHSIFNGQSARIVSGDVLIDEIGKGKRGNVPEALVAAVKHRAPDRGDGKDEIVRHIFETGEWKSFVDLWVSEAGQSDFAYDGYIPSDRHADVMDYLESMNFLPVKLQWQQKSRGPRNATTAAKHAEAYQTFLLSGVDPRPSGGPRPADLPSPAAQPSGAATGNVHAEPSLLAGFRGSLKRMTIKHAKCYIDRASHQEGTLEISGWAFTKAGTFPKVLCISLGNEIHVLEDATIFGRPDVQRSWELPTDQVGFRVKVSTGYEDWQLRDMLKTISIRAGMSEAALSDPYTPRNKILRSD